MGVVISIKGVGAPGRPDWSWCIPGGHLHDRIVVQCMTQAGPSFLPTSIAAPTEYRHLQVDYVELPPSDDEVELAEDIWAWLTNSWAAAPSATEIAEAIRVLHDLLATARFVPISVERCLKADHEMPESALYLGRSVHVRVRGVSCPVTAWITTCEDPVQLVSLDFPGTPRRFFAEWSCLMEDGTLRQGSSR
jgi:hypothetical protein